MTGFLRAALAEDIGSGDVTSNAIIPADRAARFAVNARQELVVSGLKFLPELFALLDKHVSVELHVQEGAKVAKGAKLATLSGPALALLTGERTALNLIQHLCGVATLTRQYVDTVAGTSAKILDTRKTLPGFRALEKYAVSCGGGQNHRMGLYDGVLIKDNHIAIAGSIPEAVKKARMAGKPVQVECDTLAQVDDALASGAGRVLLDNMDLPTLAEAVKRAKAKKIETEASGNVSLQTIRAIAETGVEFISIGRLTHSAPAVDIGLDAF